MILVPAPTALVVRAETLLPVSGPARTGVDVLVENGKIVRIGRHNVAISWPKSGRSPKRPRTVPRPRNGARINRKPFERHLA